MTPRLPTRHSFIAAALIWQADELLLVQQQGPEDEAAYWALSGGRVEEDEFPLQGLVREVQEVPAGAVWLYRQRGTRTEELITRLPGKGREKRD